MIAGDRGIAALQFAGDLSYHQCSIFLPSLEPIQAVGGGERSLCVGSWMGCVAEVAEPRASPRHRPVGLALRRIGLWALSRPSAHIRACCRTCGTSTAKVVEVKLIFFVQFAIRSDRPVDFFSHQQLLRLWHRITMVDKLSIQRSR